MVQSRLVFDPYLYPHNPSTFYVEKNVLSPEQCDNISAIAETYPTIHSTMGYSDQDGIPGHRNSFLSWLPQDLSIPVLEDMWSIFHDVMIKVNNKMWGFNLHALMEKVQYTKYGVGGHFGYHMDLGEGDMSVRKISGVVMLSDPSEFEGGELQFYLDQTVRLNKGDGVFFPSYLMHRVKPVLKGMRTTLVLWAGGSYYK